MDRNSKGQLAGEPRDEPPLLEYAPLASKRGRALDVFFLAFINLVATAALLYAVRPRLIISAPLPPLFAILFDSPAWLGVLLPLIALSIVLLRRCRPPRLLLFWSVAVVALSLLASVTIFVSSYDEYLAWTRRTRQQFHWLHY